MSNISNAAQNLLSRANNLPTKYFQEFTRVNASGEYDYIACIEGNDQPYYIIPCYNLLQTEKVYFLRCNGKKNVTELIDILEKSKQESYKNSRCFGLVDKDYGLDGVNLYPTRIYETPCYSYENFYLSLNCLKKVLEAHFNIKRFNDFFEDYQRVVDNYTNRLQDYLDLIVEVDKRYRATQLSAKKYKDNIPGYYSADIIFSPIKVELNAVSIHANKCFDSIFKKDISLSYTAITYAESTNYYLHSDIWKFVNDIRGKFLVPFLVSYLNKLIDDINNLNNPICFIQRNNLRINNSLERNFFYKVQLNIDSSTILSSLAQYADQPDCLKSFLSNYRKTCEPIAA